MRRIRSLNPLDARLMPITACLAAMLIVAASFPGYLNPDSAQQLEQAELGGLDDRHSPFTVIVWSLLLHLFPGAIGYLLLDTGLIWGSCLALALLWRRSFGNGALVLALLPLTPGIYNFLGNVQIDTMMVGWLLAATALACAGRVTAGRRVRLCCQVLANLCLIAGVLTRLNAIFCIIPLLLHANAGLGRRRNLIACVLILLSLPVINRAQNIAVHAVPTGVGDSIKTYNLLALSFREHRNLLPGDWTAEQSRRITEGCYSPVQWDGAWLGQCRFIFETLHAQGIWNTPRMTRAWLRALSRHPLGFVSIQLASFRQAMFAPNLPVMFWPTPSRWNDILPHAPEPMAAAWRDLVGSHLNVALSKPWLAVAMSALGVLLILRLDRPGDGSCEMALALLLSGQIYLIGFFVYGVSAEYRYYTWSGFCAAIGLIMAVLCTLRSRRRPTPGPVAPAAGLASGPALAITAVAGGLVLTAWAFQLPRSDRVVTIRAAGDGPIQLQAVHDAAEPAWFTHSFEGVVDPGAWVSQAGGFTGRTNAGPLIVRLSMPREDAEVRFATSTGLGHALIDADGNHVEIPTGSGTAGSVSILLPPASSTPYFASGFTARWTAGLGACILALFLLGHRLTPRRPHRRHHP